MTNNGNNPLQTHTTSNPLISSPITLLSSDSDVIGKPDATETNQDFVCPDAQPYIEALELAYPLALESYKEAERRMDVVEKRLQDLLAFVVTFTLAFTALFASKANMQILQVSLFVIAMLFFVIAMRVGIRARLSGVLQLVSMDNVYNRHIRKNGAQFKMAFVHSSVETNNANTKTIFYKSHLTNIVAILFLFESVFLIAWAVSQSFSVQPQNSRPSIAAGAAVQPVQSQVKPH